MPALPALLTLPIVVHVFNRYNDGFRHAGIGFDEPSFVWGGWSILKGLTPYLEFLEFKPPLIFITHALALWLHGFDGFAFREFFSYFPLGAILAVHCALLSWRVHPLAVLAWSLAVIELFVAPGFHDTALSDTESIGLSYYLYGAACLLWKSKRRALLTGVGTALLVCCVLSKEPFLPCVGLTWVMGFLLHLKDPELKLAPVKYVKVSAIGAAVIVVALCLYMIPTGALVAYVKVLRGYFKIYRDPQLSYCVVLGRFHPTTPLNDLWVQFQQARREFFNLHILGYLIPLVGLATVGLWRRSKLLLGLALVGFVAALNAVTASNCQWPHYYNMSMSGLFFFIAIGLVAAADELASISAPMRLAFCFALLAGVGLRMWPRYEAEVASYGRRPMPNPYAEQVPGSLEVIAQVTKPTDTIFTTGVPILYIQANRLNAVRESQWTDEILGVYEGDTDVERLSGVRAQLEKNRPKVMVMDPAYGPRKQRHFNALFGPYLAEHGYQQVRPYIFVRPD
ncbi:MAG: hypothetical protein JNK82_43355 [Myxococcaceae bacterium]|nr:hypothetical protein [Myxococcaceae bacterium]